MENFIFCAVFEYIGCLSMLWLHRFLNKMHRLRYLVGSEYASISYILQLLLLLFLLLLSLLLLLLLLLLLYLNSVKILKYTKYTYLYSIKIQKV